jgi:hypothetical protein
MATSGTTTFDPDVATLIEEAFDNAGYEGRSGYEYRTAARSLNFLMTEWSNLGLNLWAVDEETIPLVAGDGQYDLATDTVDMIDQVIRNNSTGQDYRISRIGVGSWAGISNKTQAGERPNQVYVERLLAPRVNVWPVPDNANYSLVYWRLRRLQDAGTPDKTIDVPFRFVPAMAAGLSWKLSMKRRSPDYNRVQMLKTVYEEQLGLAMAEDRGREPFFIYPSVR